MSINRVKLSGLLLAFFLAATTAVAQVGTAPRPRNPLDNTGWGVVYDLPATRNVKVRADVPYLRDAQGTLACDLYLPPNLKKGETRPAVIFLNAVGDRPGDKVKHWEIYRTWPRLIAAQGIVGISMDADSARIQNSLRALFDFLTKHGAEHGIDAARLGVYAASANGSGAAEYLMSETAATGIKAAVLYYTGPPEGRLRTNLPVLFVVAESDAPRMVPQLTALWQRVVETRAPWMLAFAADLPHAFDAFSDNDNARRVIQQTIGFWKTHLEPVPAPSWKPSAAREIIASMYANNPQRSAELLGKWVVDHPDDAAAHLQYGQILQRSRRYEDAGKAFERALALGSNGPQTLLGLGQIRMSQSRWEEASQLLERAITAGIQNSMTYGQLAFAQLHIKQYESAVRNYERAFELGIPPGASTRGVAWYNLACGYARLNRTDKAFDALTRAIEEGFANRAQLESDEDLASLRADQRFQALLARLAARGSGQ